MTAIETTGLTKQHGNAAVADLDLAIEEGTVFGLLRPNGAGKSTTINLLLVAIADALDRRAGGYSKGMPLVGQPDLLILDEPSTGLDPGGAHETTVTVQCDDDAKTTQTRDLSEEIRQ